MNPALFTWSMLLLTPEKYKGTEYVHVGCVRHGGTWTFVHMNTIYLSTDMQTLVIHKLDKCVIMLVVGRSSHNVHQSNIRKKIVFLNEYETECIPITFHGKNSKPSEMHQSKPNKS